MRPFIYIKALAYLDQYIVSGVDGGGAGACRGNSHILLGKDHLDVPVVPPAEIVGGSLAFLHKRRKHNLVECAQPMNSEHNVPTHSLGQGDHNRDLFSISIYRITPSAGLHGNGKYDIKQTNKLYFSTELANISSV